MRMVAALFVVLCLATQALAQKPPAPPVPPRAPKPPAAVPPPAPPAPPAAPEAPAPPEPASRAVNIAVEFTILDQAGTDAPERKVVTLVAADGTFSRVRANAMTMFGNNPVPIELNFDARPRLLENGTIRLEMTMAYSPRTPLGADAGPRPTTLNQSLTVFLQPGTPMTVSRAADPASHRRITVDVVATVAK